MLYLVSSRSRSGLQQLEVPSPERQQALLCQVALSEGCGR